MMKKILAGLALTLTVVGITVLANSNTEHTEAGNIEVIDISTICNTNQENTKVQKIGFTSANLNIRENPDVNSTSLGILTFNTQVIYTDFNDEWAEITYGVGSAYLSKNYLNPEPTPSAKYQCEGGKMKTFMGYDTITSKTSDQYMLQRSAYTGQYGIRMVGSRYCVALGNAFNVSVGQWVDINLNNGVVISAVVSDIKDNRDTDINNIVCIHDGSIVEFVVDYDEVSPSVIKTGTLAAANNFWEADVEEVIVYDKYTF